MEQFSLEQWLQDKSRKVVTRDGREVRIICWDRNTTYWKIVGLVTSPDGSTENPYTYDVNGNESDGCLHDHRNDLFFADNEELTEFEKVVQSILNEPHFQDIEAVKQFSNNLLDLARKELQPEFDKELDEAYKTRDEVVYLEGYDKGHEDVLKDLPKWKKINHSVDLDEYVCVIDFDGTVVTTDVLEKGDYFIKLNELLKLPKED